MSSEWEAFLQDKGIKDAKIWERGHYLFRKVLHDLLQYLNAYRAYIELVFVYGEQAVPESTLKWIRAHESLFEQMVERVGGFWRFSSDADAYGDRWEELIQQAGLQVEGVADLILALKQLPLPAEGNTGAYMEAGIRNLEWADRMRKAIDVRDYKRVWVMDDERRRADR